MARYTAIADVGNTLLRLLRENMSSELIEKSDLVGLCSPAEKSDYKLLLYLYHMEESSELRLGGLTKVPQQPLALDLYYLIAANSTVEVKSKALDENMILGNAVQILHDNPVLSSSDLEGSLAEGNEKIVISFVNPATHAFSSKIKESSDMLFKNIVCYKVGPVCIESGAMQGAGQRVL